MLYAFGFERVGVVSDLYFVNPPGDEVADVVRAGWL
jgi:hypothetical protein